MEKTTAKATEAKITEKAMVISLMSEWVSNKLATDTNDCWGYYDDYQYQFEKGDFIYIYVNRDLAFTFLSELQEIICIKSVYFDDNTCTLFSEKGLKINVCYLYGK